MLLRRFMQHFKEQNWFAVGLDIIVVIVGIFLGMQVAEWNDHRKDRNDETEFIGRLHEDLILVENAAARVLDRRLQTFDDLVSAVALLASENPERELSQAECTAIGNSDIINIVIADLPSLTELQSSNRLGIIQNDELRRSAVSLQQRIITLKEVIAQMSSVNHQLLMLYPELISVASFYNEAFKEFNLSTRCDFEAMRNNVAFMNTVSTNLDVYDAYLRDGLRPWRAEFEKLQMLTKAHLGLTEI